MNGFQMISTYPSSANVNMPLYFFKQLFSIFKLLITDEDIKILLEGPPHNEYWDAWLEVIDRVYLIDSEGNKWTLWQDGDLWVICDKLMHDEQYEEFFGEPRQ